MKVQFFRNQTISETNYTSWLVTDDNGIEYTVMKAVNRHYTDWIVGCEDEGATKKSKKAALKAAQESAEAASAA